MVGVLVATVVGSGLYAAAWATVITAALVAAGGHAALAGAVVSWGFVAAVVVIVVGSTLAAAVPIVLLSRGETAAARWLPTLLAGLVASGVFWGLAIAGAGEGDTTLIEWPTYFESWLCTAAAQVLAANLTARRVA